MRTEMRFVGILHEKLREDELGTRHFLGDVPGGIRPKFPQAQIGHLPLTAFALPPPGRELCLGVHRLVMSIKMLTTV